MKGCAVELKVSSQYPTRHTQAYRHVVLTANYQVNLLCLTGQRCQWVMFRDL